MPIEFRIIPTIRVEINHEAQDGNSTAAIAFMRWCIDNDVMGFRGPSTGPTGHVSYFEVAYSQKIRAYMESQGFVDGDR